MSEREPTRRALEAAVEMEIHATISTTTRAKAIALDAAFPGYDALVKALEHARQWVEGSTDRVRFSAQEAAPGEAALKQIDAALSQAKAIAATAPKTEVAP